MNRPARLQSARHWLATFSGTKIVEAYARCFGVDLECAARELRLLGVDLDPRSLEALRMRLRDRGGWRKDARGGLREMVRRRPRVGARELQLLDVELDPRSLEALRMRLRDRGGRRKDAGAARDAIPEGYGGEWDDDFAYIAGFTSGGAPFGVTWEELAELEEAGEMEDLEEPA
jgi:hypothetical protein